MRQVAIVASHALDRMGALDDIRKISLCAKHVRDQKWVLEELVRTVDRKEPLNLEEGKQLDIEMTIAITAARHSLLESRLPLAAEKCSSTGKCQEAGHDDDDPDASREAADEEIIDDIDGVHPPFAVSEDDIKTAQVALEKVCT